MSRQEKRFNAPFFKGCPRDGSGEIGVIFLPITMALRDQPYFPLYVQDYLTDEKLSPCSLSTQGVYIRIMCAFHKSETYGGILFKQIPKQNFSSIEYFAYVLSRQVGISQQEVRDAIEELLFFGVLEIRGENGVDFLFQKRMERDFKISLMRSNVAKKGGGNPVLFKQKSKQKLSKQFKQIDKQNTEYEYVYENENEYKKIKVGIGGFKKPSLEDVKSYCNERGNKVDPAQWFDYYESNGWKVGKNSMKDWKAAVRTWEKSNYKNSNDGKSEQQRNFELRKCYSDFD